MRETNKDGRRARPEHNFQPFDYDYQHYDVKSTSKTTPIHSTLCTIVVTASQDAVIVEPIRVSHQRRRATLHFSERCSKH